MTPYIHVRKENKFLINGPIKQTKNKMQYKSKTEKYLSACFSYRMFTWSIPKINFTCQIFNMLCCPQDKFDWQMKMWTEQNQCVPTSSSKMGLRKVKTRNAEIAMSKDKVYFKSTRCSKPTNVKQSKQIYTL